MIKYVNGDLIQAFEDGKVTMIAHGCNCVGGFGSGVAGQIAKRYPLVRDKYKQLHKEGGTKLGFFQTLYIPEKGWIINCGTQKNYLPRNVRNADYDAIKKTMELLYSFSGNFNTTPAIPKIGCGLAGGEWDIVEDIINKIFHDRDIVVYIL